MKIQWHLDLPDAVTVAPREFDLDSVKSWKGALIRGHDIAEMIAHEFWDNEGITLHKIHIDGPEPYTGEYDIHVNFCPEFSARRKELVSEVVAKRG